MAHLVEPGLAIETGGLNHQSISVPLSHRISEPLRIGILGQLPAVHEELTKLIESLIENRNVVGLLEDLKRERRRVNLGNALGQAIGIGVERREFAVLAGV